MCLSIVGGITPPADASVPLAPLSSFNVPDIYIAPDGTRHDFTLLDRDGNRADWTKDQDWCEAYPQFCNAVNGEEAWCTTNPGLCASRTRFDSWHEPYPTCSESSYTTVYINGGCFPTVTAFSPRDLRYIHNHPYSDGLIHRTARSDFEVEVYRNNALIGTLRNTVGQSSVSASHFKIPLVDPSSDTSKVFEGFFTH